MKKTYFITGGTGSFSKKFIEILLKKKIAKKIIIFSRDEFKQFELKNLKLIQENLKLFRFFIGDVRDKDRLRTAINEEVDIVVHTAALKQVPATEYNPFETVKTNIMGAQNVIEVCLEKNISKYNQNKNITLNQINETLALVKLQKFSLTSEKSKNDFIGENGSNLSGGERQRLAIAGAICKKADIMIFDEITNKLDETNEKLIMDTLYETNKDKTMIIVSHNKSNLSKCDYILEIQNKSVIRVLNKK